jgi:hypothetical protein
MDFLEEGKYISKANQLELIETGTRKEREPFLVLIE